MDVAAEFPHYCHDTFPLLTPVAQAYYLPAYMCFALRAPGYMAGLSLSSALERRAEPRVFHGSAKSSCVDLGRGLLPHGARRLSAEDGCRGVATREEMRSRLRQLVHFGVEGIAGT